MATNAQTKRRDALLEALRERFPAADGYLVDLYVDPANVARVVVLREGIASTTHVRLARRSPKNVADLVAVQVDAAEATRPVEEEPTDLERVRLEVTVEFRREQVARAEADLTRARAALEQAEEALAARSR